MDDQTQKSDTNSVPKPISRVAPTLEPPKHVEGEAKTAESSAADVAGESAAEHSVKPVVATAPTGPAPIAETPKPVDGVAAEPSAMSRQASPMISHTSMPTSTPQASSYIGGAPVTDKPLVINPLESLRSERPAERPKSTIPTPTIHREYGFVKLLRMLVWGGVIVALPIGASLITLGRDSAALANGTSSDLLEWGEQIFRIGMIVGGCNLLWGVFRWLRRWYWERWNLLRVMKKLIGGGILRVLVVVPLVVLVFVFVAPFVDRMLIQDSLKGLESPSFDPAAEILAEYESEKMSADDFRDAMTQLAQKSITEYDGVGRLPRGEEVPCVDFCEESYNITPASSRYLYFGTEEYQDTILMVTAPIGQNDISLLGMSKTGEWAVISTREGESNYEISAETLENYDTLAFAVTNYSASEANNFYLQIKSMKLDEVMNNPTFNMNTEEFNYTGDSCTGIDFGSIVNLPEKIYKTISDLDLSRGYDAILEQIREQNTATNQTVNQYAVVCIIPLKSGTTYDEAKTAAKDLMGWSLEFFKVDVSDFRFSALANYDLLRHQSKFYFVVQSLGEVSLIQIRTLDKVSD